MGFIFVFNPLFCGPEDELYALELAEQKRQEELSLRQFREAQRLQERERKAEALRKKQAQRKV